ncbi:uncharacterized protein N0V89_006489 [Didymosphaeria variabile]|uniref:Small ribosomal subunit protein mS38 n=1 Tax=Didymosphaeria variabile TaxID=1932322 RepID=A0A9W8XH64_9PLEO|nr:uncharacterized protein N0V89_006489 [Didymosphaeria variabile]KAJ4351150.1 hypothetical protein N0V89_006489 [Didymosphaeria variabile]
MFSCAAGRVVRSPSTLPPPLVCAFARPAALGAAQKPFARPGHQRRLSSSKASTPPDSSNGSSSTQQTPASAEKAPAKASVKKATGRAGRKRTTTPPIPALNVPHVPPTDYLQKPGMQRKNRREVHQLINSTEVKISSFFSLHRPISLDQAIPPVATDSSFESIFAARSPYNRETTVNNIQTLSSGIETLEAALAVHEEQAPAQDASQIQLQHYGSPPQVSLQELMSKFVPFRPPPPPMPLGEAVEMNNIIENVAATPSQIKKRTWSSTVVVTESTDASGKPTYSATTTPMVEIADPTAENELEQYKVRQPFLYRMSQRQNTNNRSRDILQRPDMLAISVKRQRKLKMKKHKYKKLMKRTRLLRRKLDRL